MSYKLLSEMPSEVSGRSFTLGPILISFRKRPALPIRRSRNPNVSLTVGTQKKKKKTRTQMPKPFENVGCNRKARQQFEEHCTQRNNGPQRCKKKKLLAETELLLHKNERKVVWQRSNLLFSQGVFETATTATGAHPTR